MVGGRLHLPAKLWLITHTQIFFLLETMSLFSPKLSMCKHKSWRTDTLRYRFFGFNYLSPTSCVTEYIIQDSNKVGEKKLTPNGSIWKSTASPLVNYYQYTIRGSCILKCISIGCSPSNRDPCNITVWLSESHVALTGFYSSTLPLELAQILTY